MGKIKTLVFSGGEIHDYKGCGQAAMEALSEREEFDLTYIENDLSALVAPKLDPYDLIVFYYTVGELDDAPKNGLLNYVASGKGYAGFHSAADSFRDCPEYQAMVGGHFITHPSYRQFQVSIVDGDHPITKDMNEFYVTDEQYILDYDPRVHVLASALWKGKAMPVAWTKSWGKGRVFYLSLGHNPDSAKMRILRLSFNEVPSGQVHQPVDNFGIVNDKKKINTKTLLVPPSDGRTESVQRSQRNKKSLCFLVLFVSLW